MNTNIFIGVLLSAVGGIFGQSSNYGVPSEQANYGQYTGPQTYYGYQDPVGAQYGQPYGVSGVGAFPMGQMPMGDILSLLDTAQFLLDMARHVQYTQGAATQDISRMMGSPTIPQVGATTTTAYLAPSAASAPEPVYGVPVYVGGAATPPGQASAPAVQYSAQASGPAGVQYTSSSSSYATNAESGSAALTSVDGQPVSYVAMTSRPNQQPVVMASTSGQSPMLVSGGGATGLPTVANPATGPQPPLTVR